MRSIKRKKIIKIFLFVFIFIILYQILFYLIVPKYSAYSRLMIHEMYEIRDVDVVFLGSSKMYTTINPWVADEYLGLNTFDLASSGQQIRGSYYLLKEFMLKNRPRYVVMELQHGSLVGEIAEGDSFADYIITDYLSRASSTYFEYCREAYPFEQWFEAFCRVYHYRDNFTYTKLAERIVTGDLFKLIRNEYIGEYLGKGFLTSYEKNGSVLPEKSRLETLVSVETVDDEKMYYFERIVSLCNENGIKLILITIPGIDDTINEDIYQEDLEFYSELAKDHKVQYYDMSLCKAYCAVKDDHNDFFDGGHMNIWGAEKFTKALCGELDKIFRNENVDADFFSSYEERH